jgi:hypothetical protein
MTDHFLAGALWTLLAQVVGVALLLVATKALEVWPW